MTCFKFISQVLTPRINVPVEKDGWWLTGLEFKLSLAAIAEWAPHASQPQGAACTELPPCAVFLLSGQPLQRSSWNHISANKSENFPIQLELHSYLYILNIFTDESEQLHSNQSGQCFCLFVCLHLPNDEDLEFSFA